MVCYLFVTVNGIVKPGGHKTWKRSHFCPNFVGGVHHPRIAANHQLQFDEGGKGGENRPISEITGIISLTGHRKMCSSELSVVPLAQTISSPNSIYEKKEEGPTSHIRAKRVLPGIDNARTFPPGCLLDIISSLCRILHDPSSIVGAHEPCRYSSSRLGQPFLVHIRWDQGLAYRPTMELVPCTETWTVSSSQRR